jgi:hypothetical protein
VAAGAGGAVTTAADPTPIAVPGGTLGGQPPGSPAG